MKHLFVPYSIAKYLNELGFDEPCLAYYSDTYLYITGDNIGFTNKALKRTSEIRGENLIAAPLYQQVVDWLYYPHNIVIGFAYESDLWTVSKDRKLLFESGYMESAIEETIKLLKKTKRIKTKE